MIRGTDQAMWDRIKRIPFNVRIPDEEQDKELPARLLAEQSGILAWAVRGCLEWQDLHSLGVPTEVRVATARYRQDMDTIAVFIDDCCVVRPENTVKAGKLYDAYKEWCAANGEKPISAKALATVLVVKHRPARLRRDWAGYERVGHYRHEQPDVDAAGARERPSVHRRGVALGRRPAVLYRRLRDLRRRLQLMRRGLLTAIAVLTAACSAGIGGRAPTPTTGPFQCGYELRREGGFYNRIEVMAYGSDAQVCDQIARHFFPYQMPAVQPQSQTLGRVLVCKGTLGTSEVRIYDEHPFGDQASALCTTWLRGQWVADSTR